MTNAELLWRIFGRFLRELEQDAFGKKQARRHRQRCRIPAIAVIEPQKSGNLHVHALLGRHSSRVRYSTVHDCWKRATKSFLRKAGRAHVRPYEEQKGGERYLAKYIGKEVNERAETWRLYGTEVLQSQ